MLFAESGQYYYVQTNKSDSLSAYEITSSSLESLLNKKNEFGELFIDKGAYTTEKDSFFTAFSKDKIVLILSTTLKYFEKYIHCIL